MNLPTDSQERKDTPIFSGVLKYFPLALAEVAKLSMVGNDKHNPGQPLHWSKDKSTDHGDCLVRHQIDAGTIDPDTITARYPDGLLHDVHVAWRALAQLQTALENRQAVAQLAAEFIETLRQEPGTIYAIPAVPPSPAMVTDATLFSQIAKLASAFPPIPVDQSIYTPCPDCFDVFPCKKHNDVPPTSGIGVSWSDGFIPVTENI